ncbi:hypothetical protein B711_0650 [Chlamydia psittaci CP3]|nr:hypothetical protein B711_0650 [Chlamydia psittaci CP3]
MDLYFFTPVSFSPEYIEKKVSSRTACAFRDNNRTHRQFSSYLWS